MKVDTSALAQPQLQPSGPAAPKTPPKETVNATLAPDVYHRSGEQDQTPTYSRPVVIGEGQVLLETAEETLKRVGEAHSQLYAGSDMFHAANKMVEHYDDFMGMLELTDPMLAEKNWRFSVDEQGLMKVSGDLSEDEITTLETKLNNNQELVKYANEVKEAFLKYTEMERGPSGTSSYWGKYDVNEENFADIIDMKSLMEERVESKAYKVTAGINLSVLDFVDNVAEQLKSKAEVAFADEPFNYVHDGA
ncbi:hypothetical protein L1285_08805 [Pseudoalteromonas sp. DL2-H2.2]|uniref:hypothetical protein n=1 Tax=Pseudoalteromonas sp. DL2-H2.2 TaxID=2908889 RepID=UPI001F2FA90C|nr:hypothetical protein [Pseudoalteromonas sp. DL2-H2.2]MCF2908421.1 hypothetical protein [Pseudoalteromonas sp. DL2-H2.2]